MRRRPIIGIDASRSYRSPMTGTERYSRHLVENLVCTNSPEVKYRLFFNEPPPVDAPLNGAEVCPLPSRRLWTHYRLSREMRRNPVDLLFVPSHVLPLVHPVRSVVTVHDLGYLYEPDAHTLGSRTQLRLATRWNVSQASHVIAVSEATRRDLTDVYGLPGDAVSVVPHGVGAQFRVLPEAERERYRQAARLPDRFVLYVGTVQPRKNLLRLVEAFELCAGEDSRLHLVIGGRTGWKAGPIVKRIEESPLRSRIRLLGYVPEPQLPLLYNASSALALPSLYEGFGLPALEAMACGVPAVVSDRGSLPELAGADAEVVDPLNTAAIARGIAGAAERRGDTGLVDARVEHAGRYRWDASARATRRILLDQLGIEGGDAG